MTDLSNLFGGYDDGDPDGVAPGEDLQQIDLPDGVYFDLDPTTYFAIDALGSSDVMSLARRRHGWWWKSRHNPLLQQTTTDAQNYGSALHSILLEGPEAYRRVFLVSPDKADFPGLLVSTDDITSALKAAGINLQGTSKFKKADWVQAALSELPERPVWDAIIEAFDHAARRPDGTTRPSVTRTEDAMLKIMFDMATDLNDPDAVEIARLLISDDHPPMAEVSVIYTDPRGLRRRCRFDRLFPKVTLDLKSLRGIWNGRPLEAAIDDVIKKHGYDVQRADYHEGRKYLYAFIRMGMQHVHGGTEEQRAWLATWPDRYPRWDWVWLFYQKPDMTEGHAPVVFPLWDDHASDYHRAGLRKKERALDFYQLQVDRVGLDKPWGRVSPLHYTDDKLSPSILRYPDGAEDAQQPLENEDRLLGL